MAVLENALQIRLARFEFEALFCQDLGWQPGDPKALASGPEAYLDLDFLEILMTATSGHGHGVILLKGSLPQVADPKAFYPWLGRFSKIYSDLLLIWIDPPGQRSLWCWCCGSEDRPYWRTAVVVRGQGHGGLAARLSFLHIEALCPDGSMGDWLTPGAAEARAEVDHPELKTGFRQSWQALTQALMNLPQPGQREHYAMVLLCRLIAAAALQRRGYLGNDEWYLHNQFGQSQQRGPDQFFQKVFQPLCQQGLTLPPEDRPLPVQQLLGTLPFVPHGPFSATSLDSQGGHLPIPDSAFEPVLTWLGDWLMTTNPTDLLLGLAEGFMTEREGTPLVTPEPVLQALGDGTLNATVLDRAPTLIGQSYRSIDALLMEIPPLQALRLLEDLGQLTVLDPACGSGRFLVFALRHWAELAQALRGIVALDRQIAMPGWTQSGFQTSIPKDRSNSPYLLAIYRHLLTHGLYGLDVWPPAVELARLQLFLQLVEQTSHPQELMGLPDLTLTMLSGDGLIGLVRVEAERFEQVPKKGRRRSQGNPPEPTKPLQGNLLQPLFADTYQGVLAERQVRLEHYRSQTQLLAESGSVPDYAQTEFWRDRIQALNQIAQDKLSHLLWSECSQQLGIRVQYRDIAGKRHSRLLEMTDIEALSPFHWGFYFHHVLQDRGGFDIILSHLPTGAVQPQAAEFVDRYQDLLQRKNVAASTFLHNRKQLFTIDAELSQSWDEYRSMFSVLNQYFRQSGYFPKATQSPQGMSPKRLYWSRLYLERSLQLLSPKGRCALVMAPFWQQSSGSPLRQWLQTQKQPEGVIDLANHRRLWPGLPARTTLCLLWLKHDETAQTNPYQDHSRVSTALSLPALGHLLQRLIYLGQ
jgi:hypothetical protein